MSRHVKHKASEWSSPLCTDGIYFIDEHYSGGVFLGDAEELADKLGAVAAVLLDQLRTNNAEEGC